jgi:competence protein ComGC
MKPFKAVYGEFTALFTVLFTVALFLIGIPLIFLPPAPLKKRQKQVAKTPCESQVMIPASSQVFVISKKADSVSKFQWQTFSGFSFRSF